MIRVGSALNDALNNLSKAGLVNTIRSESELEEMLQKILRYLQDSLRKKMRRMDGYPSLLNFNEWLTEKILDPQNFVLFQKFSAKTTPPRGRCGPGPSRSSSSFGEDGARNWYQRFSNAKDESNQLKTSELTTL